MAGGLSGQTGLSALVHVEEESPSLRGTALTLRKCVH